MIVTGGTVGLAEWIIDGTHVLLLFLLEGGCEIGHQSWQQRLSRQQTVSIILNGPA